VDHAELAQSVPGADHAEIVEILDHHHIGSIQTQLPVTATFDPVGSTATLVIERFRQSGLEPAGPTATLLLGAILSDTVILNSPTTTERDHAVVEYLERVLAIDATEFGREMFEATADVSQLPAEQVVSSDLSRARETAELLGVGAARLDPAWREIDVGGWAGRRAADVDAEAGGLTNWRGGPRTAPDGEPWADFARRVARAIAELAAAGGSWLVVSHGGCVRAATAHLTGADARALGAPGNGSATVFALGARPRLLAYGIVPDGALRSGLY